MSRYLLAEAALADLREIQAFVAEHDGPARADRLLSRFGHAFETLADAPNAGAARPRLAKKPVRWWTEAGFLIAYDADARPIVVLRVIHAARMAARVFRDRGRGGGPIRPRP